MHTYKCNMIFLWSVCACALTRRQATDTNADCRCNWCTCSKPEWNKSFESMQITEKKQQKFRINKWSECRRRQSLCLSRVQQQTEWTQEMPRTQDIHTQESTCVMKYTNWIGQKGNHDSNKVVKRRQHRLKSKMFAHALAASALQGILPCLKSVWIYSFSANITMFASALSVCFCFFFVGMQFKSFAVDECRISGIHANWLNVLWVKAAKKAIKFVHGLNSVLCANEKQQNYTHTEN